MGVQGLTSLLQRRGILPTTSDSIPRIKIQPNSTFAIDGSGLVYHIYSIAYERYYNYVLKSVTTMSTEEQQKHDAQIILITNLLPCMMPLSFVQNVTEEIIEQLFYIHNINLSIYLDGDQRRMKAYTSSCREDGKVEEEFNLRQFLQNHILPKSSNKYSSTNNIRNMKKTPPPEFFTENFPLPTLIYAQVIYTFYQMEDKIKKEDNNNHNLRFKIIQCTEEADRSIALASALDTTNTTYAVGNDSDYLIFGYNMTDSIWDTAGDVHVQYLPLSYLNLNDSVCEGFVINRKQVADALGLKCSGDGLIEMSIILGNDYTKEFVDRKGEYQLSLSNFYRDYWSSLSNNGDEKTNGNRFLSQDEILHIFSEDIELGYQINCPDDERLQLAIDFTRDMFSFRDIDIYPLDDDNDNDDDDISDDALINDTADSTIISLKTYITAILSKNDEISDAYNIDSLSSFVDSLWNDMNNSTAQSKLLQRQASWEHYLCVDNITSAISTFCKYKRDNGITLDKDLSPCKLFSPNIFYDNCDKFINSKPGNVPELICDYGDDNNNNISSVEASSFQYQINNVNNSESKAAYPSHRISLPIDKHKEAILKSVQENRVTIIQGETGCGKSSRVPLYILEESPKSKLFICQPRRIAAKALCERIRDTEPSLKNQVALRMGHGVKEYENKDTRAWFVTAGYLVRILANQPASFDDCTHLIIDEVHERSTDSDILCLLARRLLNVNKHIRLILMSATMSADMYRDYFNIQQETIFVGVRCYPVKEHYLEEIMGLLKLSVKEMQTIKDLSDKLMKSRCQTSPNAFCMEKIRKLAVDVAQMVGKPNSSVLIFVPGMADIVAIVEAVEKISKVGKKYLCIPIHSEVPLEEQLNVFKSTGPNEIKIIVATNAAESSLTLPDVDHVICTGLCKQTVYNSSTHRQLLDCCWISKASAKQRSGRTGRVREGSVYRLYPRVMFENYMSSFDVGELLRTPLDSVVLNCRSIVSGESIVQLLSECLEPPDISAIDRSFASLHELNFIDDPCDNFQITPLGDLVSSIGIDLMLGSLIGFGIQFGVIAEVIEIAAIVSFPKTPWLIPNQMLQSPNKYNDLAKNVFISKSKFDGGLYSELFSTMNLIWDYERSRGKPGFCKKHSISHPRLKNLLSSRDNMRIRVAKFIGSNDHEELKVKTPPRHLPKDKIILLCILQMWVFDNGIIRLKEQKSKIDDDSSYTINVDGDAISADHLRRILDEKRHNFTFSNRRDLVYSGSFPLKDENDFDENFEEHLLSFAIERKISLIVCFRGDALTIFCDNSVRQNLQDVLTTKQIKVLAYILCTPFTGKKRGIHERECGRWKIYQEVEDIDMIDSENDETKVFMKYSTKATKKKFKTVREAVSSHSSRNNTNSFCLAIDERTSCVYYSSFFYGDFDIISKHDFSDMFSCSGQDLVMNAISDSSKMRIILHKDNISSIAKSPFELIPESARLLSSIATGSYRVPCIRFGEVDDGDSKLEDDEEKLVQIIMKIPGMSQRWESHTYQSQVIVDNTSLPSTALPFNKNILYACCSDVLELKGGGIRAQGLTLLPPIKEFLGIAMICGGGLESENIELVGEEYECIVEDAKLFYEVFIQNYGLMPLLYQDDAVRNLKSIIFSLAERNSAFQAFVEEETGQFDDESERKSYDANIDKECDQPEMMISNYLLIPSQIQYKREENIHNHTNEVCTIETKNIKNESIVEVDTIETAKHQSNDPANSLQDNFKIEKGSKPKYICPYCYKQPFRWQKLKQHVKDNHMQILTSKDMSKLRLHPHQMEIVYACPKCYHGPFKLEYLNEHIDNRHDNDAPTSQILLWKGKPEIYTCYECRIDFTKWHEMIDHIENTGHGRNDISARNVSKPIPSTNCENVSDGIRRPDQNNIEIKNNIQTDRTEIIDTNPSESTLLLIDENVSDAIRKPDESNIESKSNVKEDMTDIIAKALYICPRCYAGPIGNEEELWTHIHKRHQHIDSGKYGILVRKTKSKKYICCECKEGPMNWSEITSHVKGTQHGIIAINPSESSSLFFSDNLGNEIPKPDLTDNIKVCTTDIKKKRRYVCPECYGGPYRNKQLRKNTCTKCCKGSFESNQLYKILWKGNPEVYTCYECRIDFTKWHEMIHHIKDTGHGRQDTSARNVSKPIPSTNCENVSDGIRRPDQNNIEIKNNTQTDRTEIIDTNPSESTLLLIDENVSDAIRKPDESNIESKSNVKEDMTDIIAKALYICPRCYAGPIGNEEELWTHIHKRHQHIDSGKYGILVRKTKSKKYICCECKEGPMNWSEIKRHVKGTRHGIIAINSSESSSLLINKNVMNKVRKTDVIHIDNVKRLEGMKMKYACPKCYQGPFKIKSLNNHIKEHHIEGLENQLIVWKTKSGHYSCDECNKNPMKWSKMRNHLKGTGHGILDRKSAPCKDIVNVSHSMSLLDTQNNNNLDGCDEVLYTSNNHTIGDSKVNSSENPLLEFIKHIKHQNEVETDQESALTASAFSTNNSKQVNTEHEQVHKSDECSTKSDCNNSTSDGINCLIS